MCMMVDDNTGAVVHRSVCVHVCVRVCVRVRVYFDCKGVGVA